VADSARTHSLRFIPAGKPASLTVCIMRPRRPLGNLAGIPRQKSSSGDRNGAFGTISRVWFPSLVELPRGTERNWEKFEKIPLGISTSRPDDSRNQELISPPNSRRVRLNPRFEHRAEPQTGRRTPKSFFSRTSSTATNLLTTGVLGGNFPRRSLPLGEPAGQAGSERRSDQLTVPDSEDE